ncbi:MAG: hypothetical protein JXR89_08120 [Deltaproteobacteria bacterium]|nr:hypothetical protein [Deltaproteobacteria bacterium]
MRKILVGLLVGLLLSSGAGLWAAEDLTEKAEDITRAGIVGPGSINVHKAGDIQMSFGALVRIIPTLEDNYDFGLGDVDGFVPGDLFRNHANEAGWLADGHIRTENKLYFNAMPNDKVWSFYAALEFDGILDNRVADDRGNNDPGLIDNGDSNSNYGLERLHGTVLLPFAKSLNLRLHAGWDIYELDAFDGGGLVYGDDNPGFWITGNGGDKVDFQLGFHKLKENDWQISNFTRGSHDDDRDLYTVSVDFKANKANRVRFMYAFDRIRNINTNTIQNYLFGDAVAAKLASSQDMLSTGAYQKLNGALPGVVLGGEVVTTTGTDGSAVTTVSGGRLDTAKIQAAAAAIDFVGGAGTSAYLLGNQAKIDQANFSLANNYFHDGLEAPDTDSHHIGFYYQGGFGIVKPFFEAVYQFGTADNTGLSAYRDYETGRSFKEDYDISAYALAADVAFDLQEMIGFKFEPHIGIMYTSGDDDPTDGDLEGYTGVDNLQRFSSHWGGENTIIGDTNLILGTVLYGYLPELYGSGTPVSTGGLENFSGNGGGRGDNPGLLMYSLGLNLAPKRFLIFKTNVNIFNYNEDFRMLSYDGSVHQIDSGYLGTEWDNELILALSKNMFIKTQFSFFFPGEVVEDITEAYSGKKCDDVASRLALELIWNF